MGNNNSHPEDLPLFTDEEKNKFVESYMSTCSNPRIVKYKENPLPVNDPVEILVPDTDDPKKQMKLYTYRCPPTSDQQKGIIFFVHGFQSYANRQAHLAHRFAENGYDFFAMDLRGHGKSDGDPALIVSMEQTIRDCNQFFEMSLKKFYGDKIEDLPPIYLMGNSFGCMICLNILLQGCQETSLVDPSTDYNKVRIKFTACQLISPFLGFLESKQAAYNKLFYLAKTVTAVNKGACAPRTKYTVGTFKNLETGQYLDDMEHQIPWLLDTDNKCRFNGIPFRTFLTFSNGCQQHQALIDQAKKNPGQNKYSGVTTPIQMICGSVDDMVSTSAALEVHGLLPGLSGFPRDKEEGTQKNMKNAIMLENADHNPYWDGARVDSIVENILNWLEYHS